jgi:2-keto-4-pentenoate hydratase/2-oxohepta-3-ene-1,7-dioic acid hydratase in catechol pathway
MRLARCQSGSEIFWAVVDPARQLVRPVRGAFADWAPALTRDRSGKGLVLEGRELALRDVRLLPPVEKTNKVEVVGANYAKHLDELHLEGSSQPVVFLKAYGALIGADDPIRHPANTTKLDYEVELVVVIGAAPIDRSDPLASVLGYAVGNDVSARDLQMQGPRSISMDLLGAKSQDRTSGVGPWIVTADEFPAGQPKLRMTLKVNGEVRQDGNSSEMTWPVEYLLRFADERASLEPGDILFTGTPQGVGMSSGRFLQLGDLVEAEIEGIGALHNRVN